MACLPPTRASASLFSGAGEWRRLRRCRSDCGRWVVDARRDAVRGWRCRCASHRQARCTSEIDKIRAGNAQSEPKTLAEGRASVRVGAGFRVVRALIRAFNLLLFAGLPVFLFDRRLAVFLLLASVIGRFATLLTASVVGYRRVMRRPWPKVPPVEDDDDEWVRKEHFAEGGPLLGVESPRRDSL